MATIIRQSYIDKIERYLGKETIIVLVGQRRVAQLAAFSSHGIPNS
jgi:hypothetical protein